MWKAKPKVCVERLKGKTVVVTGCSSGIGKATVKILYKIGARVIMACRNMEKTQRVADKIKAQFHKEPDVGELILKELNLSSLESVRKCADDINKNEEFLHVLINNAGVFLCSKSRTDEGFESHFGVNHIGHFLFTCLLLDKLIKSKPSTIVTLCSRAHDVASITWDDINFEKRPYHPIHAYSQSKLANLLFTVELAKRLKGKGVTAYSVHPGLVLTKMGHTLDQMYFTGTMIIVGVLCLPFMTKRKRSAKNILYCTSKEPNDDSGGYFSNGVLKKRCMDDEKYLNDAARLWQESVNMVNFDPEI